MNIASNRNARILFAIKELRVRLDWKNSLCKIRRKKCSWMSLGVRQDQNCNHGTLFLITPQDLMHLLALNACRFICLVSKLIDKVLYHRLASRNVCQLDRPRIVDVVLIY